MDSADQKKIMLAKLGETLSTTVFPFMEAIQPLIRQQLEMQEKVAAMLAPTIRAAEEIQKAMRPYIEAQVKAQESLHRLIQGPTLTQELFGGKEMVVYAPVSRSTVVTLDQESVDAVVEKVVAQLREGKAAPSGRARASYPLPEGASWAKLVVKFVDGHTVKVKYGKLPTQTFDFKDLGFWDKKSNLPDTKWEFLRAVADGGGSHTVKKFDARFNRTTKYETAQRLMAFFSMTESPFDDYRKEYGYRVKFVLLSDRVPMPEE